MGRMTREERDALIEAIEMRDAAHEALAAGAREAEEARHRCRHYLPALECSHCVRARERGKMLMKIGFRMAGAGIVLYILLLILSKIIGA